MFDAIFSSLGPVGSAAVLVAMVAPAFAVVAHETARLARPKLGSFRPSLAGWRGFGRVAYGAGQGDSARRDASGQSRPLIPSLLEFLRVRVGASAPTERRTR